MKREDRDRGVPPNDDEPPGQLRSYQSSGWLVALEHVSQLATWPNKIRMHGPWGERAVGSRERQHTHHSPRDRPAGV